MIYVDDYDFPYRRMKMSHMVSTGSLEELHEMARKIGMKEKWFQGPPHIPHYDVSLGTKQKAIENGAILITSREMAKISSVYKRLGQFFCLEESLILYEALRKNMDYHTIFEHFRNAPDGQIDASARDKIVALAGTNFTSHQLLHILDECVYYALASTFVMKLLDMMWVAKMKEEGITAEQAFEQRTFVPPGD